MKTPEEPDIQLVKITPQMAADLLKHNAAGQRPVRASRVEQYARDMHNGKWMLTGETIKLDPEGALLDGQHRLAAIVESGCTIPLLIAYGVPHEAMAVMDSGVARTFADALHMGGAQNRILLAAIVRRVLAWERGARIPNGKIVLSHSELGDRFRLDPYGFDAATRRANDVRNAGVGHGMPAGTAYYLFAQIDEAQAKSFADQFVGGAGLPARSPILALRARMLRRSIDRLSSHEQLALIIRAWNLFRADTPVDKLALPKSVNGMKLTEANFPVPK